MFILIGVELLLSDIDDGTLANLLKNDLAAQPDVEDRVIYLAFSKYALTEVK